MRIQRTANAGVLLELDGKRILLDGVCNRVEPYLPTPDQIRMSLQQDPPDALVYTHNHPDHYDELFVSHYLQNTAGPVLGPADIPYRTGEAAQLGNVLIKPAESRHIGRTDGCLHQSYILRGSKCVWFMGDASLLHWQKNANAAQPDVVIAPYGFFLGRGLEYCKNLGAKVLVILHMPLKECDPYHLWEELEHALAGFAAAAVYIPEMGQRIDLS